MLIHLIWSLLIGAFIGWIAGSIMKAPGGFLRNAILGIVGSIVGGFLGGLIGISASGLASIILSIFGACVVIYIARLIAK